MKDLLHINLKRGIDSPRETSVGPGDDDDARLCNNILMDGIPRSIGTHRIIVNI